MEGRSSETTSRMASSRRTVTPTRSYSTGEHGAAGEDADATRMGEHGAAGEDADATRMEEHGDAGATGVEMLVSVDARGHLHGSRG
jgi:hypothetical protein